ncbi:MAG TPA: hypothetical protein VKY85_16750 [Candidatus Angelobacter sp.]|nr:hypothetical protein [Candidatus Angelobacter sp.]
MDPTLFNNLLSSLRDTIFNVLTQNGTPFQQLGLTIFRTVTIIMIVIAGSRIALHGHHSLDKLRTLAGLILTVWIMLTLYTRSVRFWAAIPSPRLFPGPPLPWPTSWALKRNTRCWPNSTRSPTESRA